MPANTQRGHLLPTSPTEQSPALERAARGGHCQGKVCPRDFKQITGIVIFLKVSNSPAKANVVLQKPAPARFQEPFPKCFGYKYARGPRRLLEVPKPISPTWLKDFFLEENGAKAREGLRTNEALAGGSAAAAPRWLWSWHLSERLRESSALAARTPRWAVELNSTKLMFCCFPSPFNTVFVVSQTHH